MLAALSGLIQSLPAVTSVKVGLVSPADLAFPLQRPLVVSDSRRDVAILGRQSGKTTAAALRALLVAMRPSAERVTYITRTRKNAKRLFWGPLLKWGRKLGLDVAKLANRSELTLTVPHADGTSCVVELLGAHDEEQIGDLRGTQYDLVIVDESQLIRPRLLELFLEEVIFPGCRARQGAILLIGTPGPVKFGPFFDAWSSDRWKKWHWTAWDNPTTPPGSIEEEIADLHLTPEMGRYVREYLGQWFDGQDESRVWDYDPTRLPPITDWPTRAMEGWQFVFGIDLASSRDNDALVVLGWQPRDPGRNLYEVDSVERPGTEDFDEWAKVVEEKRKLWKPRALVGDTGGHGATKIVNTFANRMGIKLEAKPTSVEATIRLMNNDLRAGRYHVRHGGDLAQDMQIEAWEISKTGKRTIGGGKHSDLTAAARYAYEAQRAYLARGAPKELTLEEERVRAREERRALTASGEF